MPITLTETFDLYHCPSCGIAYAVPEAFEVRRRADGKSFYCPNGHIATYGETDIDRMRAQLEAQRALKVQAENRACVIADQLKRSEAAKRKLSKRLEAGVCPVAGCKRHFTNLQRHIETEHLGQAIPAAEGQKLLTDAAPKQIQ